MFAPTSDPRPSILLVDDVEANLVALEALLADLPCEIVRAGSGNEALKLLLRREFALMLLDVQMPGMDGYEVARYARENPSTRDVPIIFLTAMHPTEEGALRGYGTGAVDFLFKPVNPHVVRAKVRVFLELERGRRALAEEVKAHQKTAADLLLANEALRHFTYAASHDLRAPLRSVRGFLEALAEDSGPHLDDRGREHVERSRSAAARMVSLLDSLLAYARLQRPVAWVEVECAVALEQVRSDLAEPIARLGGVLEVAALPRLRGDPDRIYQLFLNLVGNGLKFHRPEEPPRITVSAERRGSEVVFCVEDNGRGIPAEKLATAFEAFRRLQGDVEGSGLGLTICRQITEQHGGRIWAECEVGRGSRFYVSLPAAA